MSLFALPRVGRAGLGNSLFPWARAELFAHQSGARILAPRWSGFRIGPYLRREPDKRSYTGFFQAPQYVSGLSRFVISTLGHRIPERDVASALAHERNSSRRPIVVEYSGIDGLFAPLLGWNEFIRSRLWDMTAEALRSTAVYPRPFIAMHVRRGDITRQGFSTSELDAVAQYTPIGWFVSMALAVRRCTALAAVPIIVFTDGDANEVADLCRVDGVRLHERAPAIADLWTMSQAGLLFASGFSTFGMWASFLGGMATIYAPGKLQQRVQAGDAGAVEIELPAGSDIPESAIAV